MREVTLEKDPTSVKHVVKHSVVPVTCEDIKEITLKRNLMNIEDIVKPDIILP